MGLDFTSSVLYPEEKPGTQHLYTIANSLDLFGQWGALDATLFGFDQNQKIRAIYPAIFALQLTRGRPDRNLIGEAFVSLMLGFLKSDHVVLISPHHAPLSGGDASEEYIRGPSRALQDKQIHASPLVMETTESLQLKTTAPTISRTTKADNSAKDLEEISSILHMTEIRKTEGAIKVNMEARRRFLALNRPMKLKPQALFSFTALRSDFGENPLYFGTQHIKERLNEEFKNPESVNKLKDLSEKTPANFDPKKAEAIATVKGNHQPLHVGDRIAPNHARQILLSTTWRSGSSFFGDLLSRYPGTFYSFEPLHYTFTSQMDLDIYKPATDLIEMLFKCQYDARNIGYLKHTSKAANQFLFSDNFRVWKVCQKLLPSKAACFMPRFYQAVCPLFPIRLIKTVRLRIQYTENLLQDPDLPNLKVVVLVRDPRGTMNSRSTMDWCVRDNCANVTKVCNHLQRDVQAAYDLKKKYPNQVYLVRYEDLSLDPYQSVDKVFEFLDLPQSPVVDDYIKTHTKAARETQVLDRFGIAKTKGANPYGTHRDSKSTAFAWRSKMDIGYIKHIQNFCEAPMKTMGYNLIQNVEERDNPDFPILVKTAEELWPWESNP
eukprot:maker-scaffold802_size95064-snap-gene-0.15 protein:Tk01704 transcript:maker-scaffold802_size95064-snap-gene-0.15-mRNA-1 annotation:"carbohydrate sulfotransferase 1"